MDAHLIHGSLGPPKSSTHCQFFAFFKMIPYGEIFKILFRKFSSWHWSMCCVQIREIWPTENQWNRAFFIYLTKNENKNLAWLSCCTDCTQNLPRPAPDNVLRVLLISSKLVHFRWSYIRMCEHRHSVFQSESSIRLKARFEPNKKQNHCWYTNISWNTPAGYLFSQIL